MSSRDVRIVCPRPKWITSADKRMCRASCKNTYKCVTRQQRMGEQSRLSTWPDVNVLIYFDTYVCLSVSKNSTADERISLKLLIAIFNKYFGHIQILVKTTQKWQSLCTTIYTLSRSSVEHAIGYYRSHNVSNRNCIEKPSTSISHIPLALQNNQTDVSHTVSISTLRVLFPDFLFCGDHFLSSWAQGPKFHCAVYKRFSSHS
jgi:hypothetical protein